MNGSAYGGNRKLLGFCNENFPRGEMALGVYRHVVCVGAAAIKFPRLTNFLAGCLNNQWEREMWFVWREKFGWENLCPIIFADPFGLIVIMRRALQPATFEQVVSGDIDYYPDINVEYKCENWGILEGNVVCVDYGLPKIELIQSRRHELSKFPDSWNARMNGNDA